MIEIQQGLRVAVFRSKRPWPDGVGCSDTEELGSEAADVGRSPAEEETCWVLSTYAFPGATVHIYEQSAVVMVPILSQDLSSR